MLSRYYTTESDQNKSERLEDAERVSPYSWFDQYAPLSEPAASGAAVGIRDSIGIVYQAVDGLHGSELEDAGANCAQSEAGQRIHQWETDPWDKPAGSKEGEPGAKILEHALPPTVEWE